VDRRVIHWLSPGDPGQRTGGYLYNERVISGLRARGHRVEVHAISGPWPAADAAVAQRVADALAGAVPSQPIVADGLLWTSGAAGCARPAWVLVHSPLYREGVSELRILERAALKGAHRVIYTGARSRRDLGLPGAVITPGTERATAASRPGVGSILCVATVTPRKGHDLLLKALAQVDAPWTLHCAGSLDRRPAWARDMAHLARELGLSERVVWHGELAEDELERRFSMSDLVLHAARYEAWGMGLAEALARGLPVVTTDAGVLDDLPSEAYVRVSPDPRQLAAAVMGLLTDSERCASLSQAALRAGKALPTWTVQIDRFERELLSTQ